MIQWDTVYDKTHDSYVVTHFVLLGENVNWPPLSYLFMYLTHTSSRLSPGTLARAEPPGVIFETQNKRTLPFNISLLF